VSLIGCSAVSEKGSWMRGKNDFDIDYHTRAAPTHSVLKHEVTTEEKPSSRSSIITRGGNKEGDEADDKNSDGLRRVIRRSPSMLDWCQTDMCFYEEYTCYIRSSKIRLIVLVMMKKLPSSFQRSLLTRKTNGRFGAWPEAHGLGLAPLD